MCDNLEWDSFGIGVVSVSSIIVRVIFVTLQVGGIDPVFDVGNVPATGVESAESELDVFHSSGAFFIARRHDGRPLR